MESPRPKIAELQSRKTSKLTQIYPKRVIFLNIHLHKSVHIEQFKVLRENFFSPVRDVYFPILAIILYRQKQTSISLGVPVDKKLLHGNQNTGLCLFF